ncbi:hypothetical protein ACJX0J_033822, partial [Zea mays]
NGSAKQKHNLSILVAAISIVDRSVGAAALIIILSTALAPKDMTAFLSPHLYTPSEIFYLRCLILYNMRIYILSLQAMMSEDLTVIIPAPVRVHQTYFATILHTSNMYAILVFLLFIDFMYLFYQRIYDLVIT